jgi:hypothetical protein
VHRGARTAFARGTPDLAADGPKALLRAAHILDQSVPVADRSKVRALIATIRVDLNTERRS